MKTVIEMALEAGLRVGPAGMGQTVWGSDEELERFAELVRADERARMATDKSKEAMKLALGKIKSARDCHFAAIDTLLFEAEEILEEALEQLIELVRADERNSWPLEMEAMERQVNILTDALAEARSKP